MSNAYQNFSQRTGNQSDVLSDKQSAHKFGGHQDQGRIFQNKRTVNSLSDPEGYQLQDQRYVPPGGFLPEQFSMMKSSVVSRKHMQQLKKQEESATHFYYLFWLAFVLYVVSAAVMIHHRFQFGEQNELGKLLSMITIVVGVISSIVGIRAFQNENGKILIWLKWFLVAIVLLNIATGVATKLIVLFVIAGVNTYLIYGCFRLEKIFSEMSQLRHERYPLV